MATAVGEEDAAAWVNAVLAEAATDGGVACLRHSACQLRWQTRELADGLRGRPRLGLPVTLLASAFAPTTLVLDGARRMQDELFSDAALRYIPRSKLWAFSPPDQASTVPVVLRELVALHARATK